MVVAPSVLLQWAGMATAAGGAWWLSDDDRQHRRLGFSVLLGSNALWGAWGLAHGCWGLVALQVVLATFNLRGLWRGTAPHRPARALLDSWGASGRTRRGGRAWSDVPAPGDAPGTDRPPC